MGEENTLIFTQGNYHDLCLLRGEMGSGAFLTLYSCLQPRLLVLIACHSMCGMLIGVIYKYFFGPLARLLLYMT